MSLLMTLSSTVLPAKDEPPKGQARCLSVLRSPTSLDRAASILAARTTRLLALISLVAEGKKLEDHGGLVWEGRLSLSSRHRLFGSLSCTYGIDDDLIETLKSLLS